MTQWTTDQQKVIDSSEKRIVCSAAAGSGKTAVMIGRIVRMIRDGADPFSFLVITFTNAAATEMKEKIRKALTEGRKDPVIGAAAEKAGAMEVSTIHSFCQHLIRQEFQAVRVDPSFRICSSAQGEKLFGDAFRKACNELKKTGNEYYRTFISEYTPADARKMVADLYRFIMSLPEPFEWLREKTESVPMGFDRDHPWFRTVSRMLEEKNMSIRILLRRQADMFDEYEKIDAFREVLKADMEIADAIRRWTEGSPVTRDEVTREFRKLPSPRNLNNLEIDWKDRYKSLRDELKTRCREALSLILADPEQMGKEFGTMRDSLRGLAALTEETHRFFEKNKARYCVLDFSDLEHKALEILKKEEVCRSVRGRYLHIFVDECQDVSTIQDALIQALAGDENSLFMVGDVKQSIYRFRQANPNLFLRRITGGNGEKNACFYLQDNFRSRPEILETANVIFRDVMREAAAELDYTPENELRPGKTGFTGYEPVLVDLVEPGDGQSRTDALAGHVADEIQRMVADGYCRYRDIMILMPEVSTDGPRIEEGLKSRGVPVFFDGKGDYFQQPEVEVFRSLLTLLENPHQDLPLLTVLTNAPFEFSEGELSRIRIGHGGQDKPFWKAFDEAAETDTDIGHRCRKARESIGGWRFLSKHMPLSDLLWYLIEDTTLYAVFGATEHGLSAQKNLRTLCLQGVRAAERGVCSLRDFLDLLTEQASGGEMQAAQALGDQDNVVRIMTMHKSKGLQFPVVFCVGLEKGLTGKKDGAMEPDADLGICLPYKVPKWRLSRKTAADDIFRWKKDHDVRAERICLLYVAVTRAERKLFLVGTQPERPLWSIPPGDHRVLAAADYMDWIVPALRDQEKKSTNCSQDSKPWKIRVFDGNQQQTVDTRNVFHSLEECVDSLLSTPPVDDLWNTEPDENDDTGKDNLLRKFSVTKLVRSARDSLFLEDEQTPEEKRTPDYVERAMGRYRTGQGPAFSRQVKAEGGAARGTVIHRFLSLVDLDAIRKAGGAGEALLEDMLEGLTEQHVFTEEEAGWIRPEKISRFFDSPVGRRMLASPEVHREWDFNLCLRERGMIVQGMIDCAFREGDGWILLDYKTDSIADEQAFIGEYRPQMEWYAAALRELTGKPVTEKWLYALSVDKAYAL